MFKTLSKSIREYKKPSILTALFGACEVALEVTIPFLMAGLIDKGVAKGNISYVVKIGIVLILLSTASLGFGAMSGRNSAKASVGFASNLRKDMFYKVQKFSFSNIDKFSSSSIVTRLTTDVSNVQHAYHMIIRMAVRSPVMIIFALIMAFQVNSSLSLIYLAMIPVLGIALFLMIKYVYPIFNRVFETYDKLNRVVQENLRGIRVVKSFVREEYEVEKFQNVSEDIYKDFVKAESVAALTMPFLQFCIFATMLLISWFGAKLIVSDKMTTGNLFSMFTYTMQILINLMMLAMTLVMITISRTSGDRIAEVLVEQSDIIDKQDSVLEVTSGDILFNNVSFSYSADPSNLCLFDINLEIKSGETVGIIGPTGSSKTTLVQLIPRLYDATIGTVLVSGVDVRDYEIEALRNSVSMVLQKNLLFSGTVSENLRWGDETASDKELIRVCKLAQADDFIRKLDDGYNSIVEQGGVNFSGGQQQRLCIARALLKKPKILILDDSTSAVDTKTDSLLRAAIYSEIPETTKIIIAQRISSVENADKIVIMDNGKIQAVGTHRQLLMDNEMYKSLYNSQLKGGEDNE